MLSRAVLLLLILVGFGPVSGCQKQEEAEFSLSSEDILGLEGGKRGMIYAKDGADGPYREGATTQGRVNAPGFILAGHGKGQTKIAWPATKGYFYEGTSYLNEKDGAYIVVRKVPMTEGDKEEEK